MMKFNELKAGDFVIVNNEGDLKQGEITAINTNEKQICVNNGTQDFWYELDQLSPIPLNEEQLLKLKFTKQINADGTVKYLKGAFRMLLPTEGNFSKFEIWYRDEKRHIMQPIFVHQLQNHFLDMTKVHLNEAAFS
ncbi:MAG: hypothetical protein IPJ81_10835 [Chitinophagaceae bacterium]|nr:hypothetical protein [Chitinophagaceae bacterium]